MKTLLILRHGKSSWKYVDLADHDRPLKGRGKDDAEKIAKLIEDKDLIPQHIISSTAKRAQKTADLVANACDYNAEIEKDHDLYLAGAEDIAQVLSSVDDRINRLMIVGHNPGLEETLSELTESFHSLPTCALAHVDLPITSWEDISLDGSAKLVNLWVPRQL